MQLLPLPDQLSDKHYVTMVVRLLLDRHDQLVRGEIFNVEQATQGHFEVWQNMLGVLRSLLNSPK